jgi:hypothetical protein
MGKRDWGWTVLMACLIALAGLLRSHTVPLVLLSAGAVASAAVVIWDIRRKPRPSKGSLRVATATKSAGVPLVTTPPMYADEQELRSIAAGRDPRFAQYRRMPAAKRDHACAERQLAAAIRSGNCLRDRGHGLSPLGLQWYRQTEALVQEIAGELDASRLNSRRGLEAWISYLDDLAAQATEGGRQLTPSDSWDAYVERMNGFRQDVGTAIAEGDAMRGDVFEAAKVDRASAEAKVNSWLGLVQEAFGSVSELRGLPTSPYAPGIMVGYEGLSQEQSVPVWRLYSRLDELGPVLYIVAPYVQALKGE